MGIEHKTIGIASLKAADGDEGIVEIIPSVFGNVDSMLEVIKLGAFAKSLQTKLPKGVWSHDWGTPVAKTLEARELAPGDPLLPERLKLLGGLYVKAQFNMDTQRGREAFSDVKFGTIDEFSIGYRVKKATEPDPETGVRELQELELYEWSPVLVGANRETAVLSAKSCPDGMTLEDQCTAFLDNAKALHTRLAQISAIATKEGRPLSAARIERLTGHAVACRGIADDIDEMVIEAMGGKSGATGGDEAGTEEEDLGAAAKAAADEMESMNLQFRAVAISAQLFGV